MAPYYYGSNYGGTDTTWTTNSYATNTFVEAKVMQAAQMIQEVDLFARRIQQSLALARIRFRQARPQSIAAPRPIVLRMERRARHREGVRSVIRQRRRIARFA